MFSRAARAACAGARRSAAAPRSASRRQMGGGGEPGTLFGEKAGQAREGWEPIVYSCYAASAVLLIVGLANKPTTSINAWAKDEANARLKLKREGEDVEYGTHYNSKKLKYTFTKDAVGAVPTNEADE